VGLISNCICLRYTAQFLFRIYDEFTGPLSSIHLRFAIGYSNSSNFEDPSWPDLYHIVNAQGIDQGQGKPSSIQNQRPGTFDKYYQPHLKKDAIVAAVFVVRRTGNRTDGNVRLASSNHDDSPLIDPKYLNDQMDVEQLIDG